MVIDKLKDLEYNELVALAVIEKDTDLKEIFSEEFNMTYPTILYMANEGELTSNMKVYVKSLFEKIIVSKPNLIEWYLRLSEPSPATNEEVKVAVIEEEEVKEEEVKIPIKEKVKKLKKEKTLPRRYGKANILVDIEKQGGKATTAQLTALAINKLKNIYVNLNARLVSDMLSDKRCFTDEEYRDIRSTIQILEYKMKPLLAKKK
jgi:hypothetical protein